MLPALDELNALDRTGFVTALEPLFERAPRFLARLADERPFESYGALLDRAREVALAMPEDEQIALIDSHPHIGAAPATVSAASFHEQGYDRDPGTADLQARLDGLNQAYERRFGFRFVTFVAGRPRSEIARIMEAHLDATRDEEKQRALSDVFAIAHDRLAKLRGMKEGA
ncbi:MAG TPA: 2-oxo-4-hydroxy-4-carboxy-5-ureidoimidazoline decarboxylase [Candidatus Limnocylindria bacterium]|nr:2-oxo-4-hydroxy-4-carboxy-5-ureidoimidazoline decarboxylase [Candidatus Limnocylindria bacterium]